MKNLLFAAILCFFSACSPTATAEPTATLVPEATNTTAPSPTVSPLPPTDTPLPPTETPLTPTSTPLPPTDTPDPLAHIICPPGAKMSEQTVTMTLVNKSGFEILMKLESCGGDSKYNLTLPAGEAGKAITQQFKLAAGTYKRMTTQCQNMENSGQLVVDSNMKMTFSACASAAPTLSLVP